MLLHKTAEHMHGNSASQLSISRALCWIKGAIVETCGAAQGLRFSKPAPGSLEEAFSALRDEFTIARSVEFRIFVNGRPKELQPAIREQVFLIGREALSNAVRHSGATAIEAELEYLRHRLRVIVRDNGRGIASETLRSRQDSHRGVLGMKEKATSIGARLRISSGPGAGTEVEISVPLDG